VIPLIPVVYVGFSAGTSWLSRLIQWFTGGRASHVFLAFYSSEFGGWLQLGSEVGGWVFQPAEQAGGVCAVYEMPVDLWPGLRGSRQYLGTPYDIGGLAGMAWVMVAWRWLGRRVRNPLESHASWFCSEICAEVVRRSGVRLALAPGETDPSRLEQELLNAGARAVPVPWGTP
jgi:hypothetical protein